jgi:probable HAF family extracellular repeat protein
MRKTSTVLLSAALALSFVTARGQTNSPATTPVHAVVWAADGTFQDLGTLGGDNSYALGINNHGVVVGYSYLADNVTFHAFLWSPTKGMTDIGATLQKGQKTWGVGINDHDTAAVTGFLSDGSAVPAAFHLQHFWSHLSPGDSLASLNRSYGINDNDQVTGQLLISGFKTGFLWDVFTGSVTFVPSLGGGNSIGVAVNNLGHITGAADIGFSNYDALFWSADGGSRDIGFLNGSGFTAGGGINDNDEVVGYNLPALAGFYWSDATGMVPLRSLGGSVSAAFSINGRGAIAGESSLPDGTIHAVRWPGYTSAPEDLGTLTGSGNSYGKAINSAGTVAGYSDAP